jgi:Protein of unknown function (DUF4435)
MFQRTSAGKAAKFFFFQEILIWIEGSEDYDFYYPIVKDLPCRLEVADGDKECLKLAKVCVDEGLPFVVVIDGHYEFISSPKPSPGIIRLLRHSHENYYFEKVVFDDICHRYLKSDYNKAKIGATFVKLNADIYSALINLVIADYCNYLDSGDLAILTNRIEILLKSVVPPVFSKQAISNLIAKATANVPQTNLNQANTIINNYLKTGEFAHLIAGHILFGYLRYAISATCQSLGGKKHTVDDDSLRIMLSSITWSFKPNQHHKDLESEIRKAVGLAEVIRPNFK